MSRGEADASDMRQSRRTHDGSRAPDVPRDRGATLTENLVAMVLGGTVVLALMIGTWTVIRTSRQNDEQAKTEAVLGSAADRIANYRYIPCPENVTSGGYEEIGAAAAAGVKWDESVVEITDYKYWDPQTEAWTDSNAIDASGDCNTQVGLTTSATLQKITVEVTSPTTGFVRSMDVVKADIRPEEVKDETAE